MDTLNRATLGVRVPAELVLEIDRAALGIKRKPGILDMRWNQPSEYILPMVSFGEVSVATLGSIQQTLQPVCNAISPFKLECTGFEGIPNRVQPRFALLAFGGEDLERLRIVVDGLDKLTRDITPMREGKAWQPHLILGRIKTESEPLRVALGRAIKMADPPVVSTWYIPALELLVAKATTQGMGYELVASFPLLA